MSRQAQVLPDALSFQQLLMLESIARRLAAKYPPDWLERQGRALYLLTLALSFLAAVLLGVAWGPWWGFLIPLFMPTLLLVALPRLLFGRVTGRPRWAHPLATLDRHDAELVRRTVASMRSCSSIDGERFFEIWRHARRHAASRHG